MSGAASQIAWSHDDILAEDLVRESKAARVRQLMGDGLGLSEIAQQLGISEAEVREWMDEGRVVP